MKNNKKVFFWTTGLDDFIDGKGNVGGLTVQMYFWSQVFAAHNWQTESLTLRPDMDGQAKQGIRFSLLRTPRFIAPLLECWKIFSVTWQKPDLILLRGATRSLGFLAFFCRLFRIKLVLMFASDSDLKPEEELIDARHDRKLFRWGLRKTRYFICQNQLQMDLLEKNYHLGNSAMILPNIWMNQQSEDKKERRNILWVANFRDLKRPEMFLKLAKCFPDEHFVMAGGFQTPCFEKSRKQAESIHNLEFLGPVPFAKSQKLFTGAKLFVCTSTIEGFPNTFLQAFSNGIPVLTTFDPSDIVKNNQLGLTAENDIDLQNALLELLDNREKYEMMSHNVRKFFAQNYSLDKAYQKIIKFVGEL